MAKIIKIYKDKTGWHYVIDYNQNVKGGVQEVFKIVN